MSNNKSSQRKIDFDANKVPKQFRILVPLVQEWSIADEGELEHVIDTASQSEIQQLVTQIDNFPYDIGEWLLESDKIDEKLPNEKLAFMQLITAYDYARFRLWEEDGE